MNELKTSVNQKKQETLMMILFALLLALIILVSKFVIGINFSLMEQGGYISIGYHEVHGNQIWALEFESFSGSISADGILPDVSQRKLTVYSDTNNSELSLEIKCGKEKESYTLTKNPQTFTVPGEKAKFTMTLSGNDVYAGYFNAVWE
ncbi:MAG: hypothetical protein IJI14_11985 [Anaerolineaceae bacterium]|nr:hypothetical protein [Anaerolineaceae bacterium]